MITTPQRFAVSGIRRWRTLLGRERCPTARRLSVTVDAGGSNGYRNRLWKTELSKRRRDRPHDNGVPLSAQGPRSRTRRMTGRHPSDEMLVVTGRGTGRISPMADLADESADFSVTVSSIPRKQRR